MSFEKNYISFYLVNLFRLGNTLVLSVSCPDCDVVLDPRVFKFCYGCGKTIQEIVSLVREKGENYYGMSNISRLFYRVITKEGT